MSTDKKKIEIKEPESIKGRFYMPLTFADLTLEYMEDGVDYVTAKNKQKIITQRSVLEWMKAEKLMLACLKLQQAVNDKRFNKPLLPKPMAVDMLQKALRAKCQQMLAVYPEQAVVLSPELRDVINK